MSEPESLSTEEGLKAHIRRHSYDRLLMLSDGIFAIATTLAALEVRLPEHWQNPEALFQALKGPLIAYVLSFLVTAVYWISHRNLFARLRSVDTPLTLLNLLMLCMIALVPAALHGAAMPKEGGGALRFYALTMLICGLSNSGMWLYASLRPALMSAEVTLLDQRWRAGGTLVIPLIFGLMLVLPSNQIATALLPAAVAAFVFRRIVIPRLASTPAPIVQKRSRVG